VLEVVAVEDVRAAEPVEPDEDVCAPPLSRSTVSFQPRLKAPASSSPSRLRTWKGSEVEVEGVLDVLRADLPTLDRAQRPVGRRSQWVTTRRR
jgi:hypothetical protein